jgi:hypothetical protein
MEISWDCEGVNLRNWTSPPKNLEPAWKALVLQKSKCLKQTMRIWCYESVVMSWSNEECAFKMFFDFHGTLKFALLCLVDEIRLLAAKKIEWVFPFGTIFHYRFLGTFSAKKWWHSSDIRIF